MTDPSPELIVCDGIDHLHCGRKASLADLVAVVSRGVEEGTIEGEVLEAWLSEDPEFGEDLWALPVEKRGVYLVIPVDGGES